jgi:ATP-dependent helicase/DNAse subunit B
MIGILHSVPPMQARDRPRDYLSYSAISTYASCPLRYYFRYIANLPERTISSSLVFGSAIHRSVEHHFNELMAGKSSLP